ncbi:MAG: hypothetical protein ABJ360_17785 [Roseobacter sp.]|uniref:hypothetical protein n=1 Tax=Tateyamaria sp. TaxID=1929288 RepID=UPI00326A6E1D
MTEQNTICEDDPSFSAEVTVTYNRHENHSDPWVELSQSTWVRENDMDHCGCSEELRDTVEELIDREYAVKRTSDIDAMVTELTNLIRKNWSVGQVLTFRRTVPYLMIQVEAYFDDQPSFGRHAERIAAE